VNDEAQQVIHGDYLFNDILHTINNFRDPNGELYVLRLDQQKMAAFILSACLPMIYSRDLEIHKDRILRILKVTEIHELLLILASRRVGKTTGIAAVAAALIICKPEITATIFANVRTGSKRVMRVIIKFLNRDPRGRAMLADKRAITNQEQMILFDPIHQTEKILEVYAATTNVCSFFLLSFILHFFSFKVHLPFISSLCVKHNFPGLYVNPIDLQLMRMCF
jgi:hypothetical protein